MVINVPFVEDKREGSCQGLACVKMVLEYYYPNRDFKENKILTAMRYKLGHWLYPTHIVTGLHKFGIKVKYFYKDDILKVSEDINNLKILTGKDTSEISIKDEFDIKNYDETVDYTLKNNLYEKKEIKIEEIKNFLKKGYLLIVVIDRNILEKTRETYKGHYTLLKGMDKNGFILNEPFIKGNLHVAFEVFAKAFNSPENFRDVILIGH